MSGTTQFEFLTPSLNARFGNINIDRKSRAEKALFCRKVIISSTSLESINICENREKS